MRVLYDMDDLHKHSLTSLLFEDVDVESDQGSSNKTLDVEDTKKLPKKHIFYEEPQ